jgi:hypothetical protein
MLFMIVERFRSGGPDEVGARFKARGRLMPDGSGAVYVASWIAADGGSCYQLMEAPSRAALDGWMANWLDLVEFEVVEVKT